MRISTVIAGKGAFVATIRPTASVTELLEELAHYGIGALVVSSDGVGIEGIVSERDVVRHLQRLGPGLLEQPVAAIMTAVVLTCGPSDEVDSVMSTMTTRRVRHLPVVSGGALVGIVSIGDVVKSRVSELELERETLVNYITTGR